MQRFLAILAVAALASPALGGFAINEDFSDGAIDNDGGGLLTLTQDPDPEVKVDGNSTRGQTGLYLESELRDASWEQMADSDVTGSPGSGLAVNAGDVIFVDMKTWSDSARNNDNRMVNQVDIRGIKQDDSTSGSYMQAIVEYNYNDYANAHELWPKVSGSGGAVGCHQYPIREAHVAGGHYDTAQLDEIQHSRVAFRTTGTEVTGVEISGNNLVANLSVNSGYHVYKEISGALLQHKHYDYPAEVAKHRFSSTASDDGTVATDYDQGWVDFALGTTAPSDFDLDTDTDIDDASILIGNFGTIEDMTLFDGDADDDEDVDIDDASVLLGDWQQSHDAAPGTAEISWAGPGNPVVVDADSVALVKLESSDGAFAENGYTPCVGYSTVQQPSADGLVAGEFMTANAVTGLGEVALKAESGTVTVTYQLVGEEPVIGQTINIPEPATMSLLALGGLGALIRRRRK